MIRRPPRSTQSRSSAASDVYKRQGSGRASGSHPVRITGGGIPARGCGGDGRGGGPGACRHDSARPAPAAGGAMTPRPTLQGGVIIVPSALTLGNLFFGMWAIVSASRGDFTSAAWLIVLAGI